MPRKVLAVIGALSNDTICITREGLAGGSMIKSQKSVKELGGRAATIAVAAYRSCHQKPKDGTAAREDNEDTNAPEIRAIGAVADEVRKKEFVTWLTDNGVNADGVRIKEGSSQDQDEEISIYSAKEGTNMPLGQQGVSQNWTPEDFDDIEKVGGGSKPDLVVVTTELPRPVVQRIIDTASSARVDVVVYSAPAVLLGMRHFEKTTHLICSVGDAAEMLSYSRDEVDQYKWPEMRDDFYESKKVKNVVLKAGHFGSLYRNEDKEGIAFGYMKKKDVIDTYGANSSFVGTYAMTLLESEDLNSWDVEAACGRANKASALTAGTIGYKDAMPWRDQIDEFDSDQVYHDLSDLEEKPETGSLSWNHRRDRSNASGGS